LLANAYVTFAENKTDEAQLLVSEALLVDPKNIDALLLKGHIAFALNNFAEAAESYKHYEELQPKIGVTKLLIANSLLRDKKYSEAEKYADKILATISDQPLANYVKSVAMFEKKNFELAKAHAETALNQNYNLPILKLIAGTSAYNLNNFESAHHHLNVIAKQMPPNHYSRKILAISQLQLGLIEDINDTLIGFNATTAEEVSFLSSVSYQLAGLGALNEAKTIADQATQSEVEPNEQQSVRSGVLKLMMNDLSGVEDLELALEANPNLEGAELAIAYAALQTGDFEKALTVAKTWQEKQPDIAGSYNMLAAVYMAQQKNELATQALQTSLTKEANNLYALTELAKINFTAGNKKEAEKFAQLAVEKYPDNARALRYYYASTSDENALAKIKQAYEKNSDNITLNMLYVDALINTGDLTQALVISTAIDSSVKTPKKAWLQRVAIYKKQQNELQLISTMEQWIQVNPYHIEPTLMLAEYYVKQRQAERALQYLDKALSDHHKESLILKIVKMQLLLDAGNVYEAKRQYQDPQFATIKPTLISGLEGRIALLEKDFAKASEKLRPFYNAHPSSQNALLFALALRGNNTLNDAIVVLEKYLENNKGDDRVRSTLANFYLQEQPEKAITSYEKILESQPKNIVVLNNLAWLALEKGNIESAEKFSTRAYKLAPEIPNVVDTHGMILFKAGRTLDAWELLALAYKLSEGKDIAIRLNYAEVLIGNDKKREAKKLLVDIVPTSKEIQDRKKELLELTKNK
jgi:putative PEP-CTERM system TPR-repeat lipoprotein